MWLYVVHSVAGRQGVADNLYMFDAEVCADWGGNYSKCSKEGELMKTDMAGPSQPQPLPTLQYSSLQVDLLCSNTCPCHFQSHHHSHFWLLTSPPSYIALLAQWGVIITHHYVFWFGKYIKGVPLFCSALMIHNRTYFLINVSNNLRFHVVLYANFWLLKLILSISKSAINISITVKQFLLNMNIWHILRSCFT